MSPSDTMRSTRSIAVEVVPLRPLVLRLSLLVFLVASLVVLLPHNALAASTFYVDDDGSNDGLGNLDDPWRTIERAITAASAGDTILVLPGTYAYEPAGQQDFPIYLPAGVRLVSVGGSYVTEIEGNGTHSVIVISNASAGTEVSGFAITNGSATGGGGLRITRSSGGPVDGWPLVTANDIYDNEATTGGGIYMEGVSGSVCAPRIKDNEIWDNDAPSGAGIACNDHSSPEVRGNYVHNNTSGEGFWAVNECEPYVVGNQFSTNGARGIYISLVGSPVVRIFDNIIGGNQGGLFLSSGTYEVERNHVSGNGASADGGGLFVAYSSVTCSSNLWNSNFCSGDGGAGYVAQGAITYNGDTFYGNTAIGWPGVFAEDTPMQEGDITLKNCILWGHASQNDAYNTTISHCDTQDSNLEADGNTVGLGMIHTDPSFVTAGTDLRLQDDSPCIDTGDPKGYPDDDYYRTSRPQDGDASGLAKPDMGFYEYPEPIVDQFSGSDRYDTAVRIVREWFPEADIAVIASGEGFADALSASGLAGSHHAPLLLTKRDSLPSGVSSVLADMGVTKVVLVGGASAVSAGVEAELAADYDVQRIAGSDRYSTAAEVARAVAAAEAHDQGFHGWAFIARGDEFPDALALAPISYTMGDEHEGGPILLTRPGSLPTPTRDILEELDMRVARIAGGTGAVSAGVESQINAILAANYPGTWDSDRWDGSDRYATAAAVADGGIVVSSEDCSYVGVATGVNFPDALAGGAAAASRYEGVVLLTRPDSLPKATHDWIEDNRDRLMWAEVYGGEGAVSSAVTDQMESALGW